MIGIMRKWEEWGLAGVVVLGEWVSRDGARSGGERGLVERLDVRCVEGFING